MQYKKRLMFLGILIGVIFNNTYSIETTDRDKSELIVSGKGVLERIEGSILVNEDCYDNHKKDDGDVRPENGIPKDGKIDHGVSCGENPIRAGLWADQGATVVNLGSIKNNYNKYESQFGSVLGIGWVENPLEREDNLVVLKGSIENDETLETKLYNDGNIVMSGITHKCHNIISIADLAFFRQYANYTKNVISADKSRIENRGIIAGEGDTFEFQTDLAVDLLKYNEANYYKNIINITDSTLINEGRIEYGRDKKAELVEYVGVDIAKLGLHYNRDIAGVLSNNSYINNSGTIFVGGDFIKFDDDWDGVKVDLLGADLVAVHNKYGIKSNGGEILNTGVIEVERDYTKGLDADNTILDLRLFYEAGVALGLLNFDTASENSIGVYINNGGNFTNKDGRIKVGANQRKNVLEILDNSAIGVVADGATVDFNGGKIELEGTQVWAGSLRNGATMTFRDNTEIVYQTKEGEKDQVNSDIFGSDGTGLYKINGNVKIYGKTIEAIDQDGNVVIESEEFKGDLHLGHATKIEIGVAQTTELVKDENGKDTIKITDADHFGKLEVTGKLTADSEDDDDNKVHPISLDTAWFVGREAEQSNYIGDVLVSAEEIVPELDIISNSYLYKLTIEKNEAAGEKKAEIIFNGLVRKDFNDIVKNSELGAIFEDSYATANEEQLAVYRILAQGENEEDFDNIVDEVTGKDILTTLPAQIYDITRDLNKQFKDFAINNSSDGIVFKYINSDSELDSTSSTVGFDRESSGIMVGYNNNISEKLRLGLGFSYMNSDIDYTSDSQNKVKTWNIRGYSDYDLGFAKIFNDLSFGYNQSENKRMADQLAYTGVKEGDLDIYTLSLNNSLYKEYKINDRLTITPSLNLDFTYISQEDFEEDGSLGASADEVDTYYVTSGVALDGKYNLLTLNNSKINLNAGIDYSYDIFSDDEDMRLKVSAFDPYYKEELRELDKKSFSFNIGANYEYKDRYAIGVKYTKELVNDVDNDQIGVDFSYKF